MTTLIQELDYVVYRVLMLAPSRQALKDLELEFRTQLEVLVNEKEADIRYYELPATGAWKSWLSFDLGKRGHLKFRVMLIGMVTKEYAPDLDLWESFDAYLWAAPVESTDSNEILRLKVPSVVQGKPCLVWGLNNELSEEEDLRAKAIKHWFITHFTQRFYLNTFSPEELSNGLEWALSSS